MKQYTVVSGQNIYDVAITLYGNIEGVFDLLLCNREIDYETIFKGGEVLDYHDEYVMNPQIADWIQEREVKVRNGEMRYRHQNVLDAIAEHISDEHPEMADEISSKTPDEADFNYWKPMSELRMVIKHVGATSAFRAQLYPDKHLIVDWGDTSALEIVEGTNLQDIEHHYKDDGVHIIKLHGDFRFTNLDLSDINGEYYPTSIICADKFASASKSSELNNLIITK